MKRRFALALAVLLLVVAPAVAGPAKPLGVGQPAPDFTLADQLEKPVRLSELLAKRQYVVVAFYVAAFTPG